MKDLVRISILKPEQRAEALNFVQRYYQKTYGTCPTHLLENCFIAVKNEEILGVIGLEFCLDSEQFEVEKLLEFNADILRKSRSVIVSLGRWASIDVASGRALAFKAIQYSIENGKQLALAVSKPRVLEYLRKKYHLRFNSFRSRIRKNDGANFFREGSRPMIYSWKLSEWAEVLKEQLSAKIEFDQ